MHALSAVLKWNLTACALSLLYSRVPLFLSPGLPSVRAGLCKAAPSQGCPGGLGLNISPSNAGTAGSIPGWGPKVPYDSWPKKHSIKQRHRGNKLNKGFKKMVHIKKNLIKLKKELLLGPAAAFDAARSNILQKPAP